MTVKDRRAGAHPLRARIFMAPKLAKVAPHSDNSLILLRISFSSMTLKRRAIVRRTGHRGPCTSAFWPKLRLNEELKRIAAALERR